MRARRPTAVLVVVAANMYMELAVHAQKPFKAVSGLPLCLASSIEANSALGPSRQNSGR